MSMSIKQNFVTDLENFSWDKDWRASRIVKEKRVDGEYYFASIIRYYGEKDDSHDYDIGDTIAESAWLGRNEKFVGKRVTDLDRDSKTFGKRIWTQPITEIIEEEDDKGKPTTREVLVDGKTIYEYTIKVTPENTKRMQSIAGAVSLNQETQFLFVYGAVPPLAVDPETFWQTSVKEYLDTLKLMNVEKIKKSPPKSHG